MLGQFDKLIVE